MRMFCDSPVRLGRMRCTCAASPLCLVQLRSLGPPCSRRCRGAVEKLGLPVCCGVGRGLPSAGRRGRDVSGRVGDFVFSPGMLLYCTVHHVTLLLASSKRYPKYPSTQSANAVDRARRRRDGVRFGRDGAQAPCTYSSGWLSCAG